MNAAGPTAMAEASATPPDRLPERIESQRLLIRLARPGDGPALNAAVLESLPALQPWLPWTDPAPTVAQSEQSCRRALARWLLDEDLMALFILKDGGEIVGGSGLHNVDWKLRRFEVGYWGRTRFGGRGLMTEGVRALADHALQALRARRVFLSCDARNLRSRRLAERAGFAFEGILRNERLDHHGAPRDTCFYACVPGDAERGQSAAWTPSNPPASSP